jgi:hypothetical protein
VFILKTTFTNMVSLFISYALNQCSIASVTETFDMTFDGDVVEKVSEVTKVDNATHKPFKMFWIEVSPNRRMNEFLADIKAHGSSRLYFKEKGVDRFWNVRINETKDKTFKPFIVSKTADEELVKVFNDFILTAPIQKRIQEVTEQDAFNAAEMKKLVQAAEDVLEPEIALKRFLDKERAESAKRLDAFMASQGETELEQNRRHFVTRMEALALSQDA